MTTPILQVVGLVKTFPGGVHALDGLTLAIEPDIICGLLRLNGARKTTLIRVLATLLPPGEVRARIGWAGQYAVVDDFLSGRENVEMVGPYGLSPAKRDNAPLNVNLVQRQVTQVVMRRRRPRIQPVRH